MSDTESTEGQRHPTCQMAECAPDCLERAECVTHTQYTYCGMCPEHNRPRHDCGCFADGESEEWWPTPVMVSEAEWDADAATAEAEQDMMDMDSLLWDRDFYRNI